MDKITKNQESDKLIHKILQVWSLLGMNNSVKIKTDQFLAEFIDRWFQNKLTDSEPTHSFHGKFQIITVTVLI